MLIQKGHRKSSLSSFRHEREAEIEGIVPKSKISSVGLRPGPNRNVPNGTTPVANETTPKLPKPRVAVVEPPAPLIVEDTSNARMTNLCAKIVSRTPSLKKYGCLLIEAHQHPVESPTSITTIWHSRISLE